MGAHKEAWIIVHDALIEEYMHEHPNATVVEATEATSLLVEDAMADLINH